MDEPASMRRGGTATGHTDPDKSLQNPHDLNPGLENLVGPTLVGVSPTLVGVSPTMVEGWGQGQGYCTKTTTYSSTTRVAVATEIRRRPEAAEARRRQLGGDWRRLGALYRPHTRKTYCYTTYGYTTT